MRPVGFGTYLEKMKFFFFPKKFFFFWPFLGFLGDPGGQDQILIYPVWGGFCTLKLSQHLAHPKGQPIRMPSE